MLPKVSNPLQALPNNIISDKGKRQKKNSKNQRKPMNKRGKIQKGKLLKLKSTNKVTGRRHIANSGSMIEFPKVSQIKNNIKEGNLLIC